MKVLSRGYNLFDTRWVLPVMGGMLIAAASAFTLRSSYIWSGLVAVGLTVFVMSFTARNFRSYWLAVFALVLPLEIKKLLIDSDYVREIVNMNTLPVGARTLSVRYTIFDSHGLLAL
jgi:hypothetical protein